MKIIIKLIEGLILFALTINGSLSAQNIKSLKAETWDDGIPQGATSSVLQCDTTVSSIRIIEIPLADTKPAIDGKLDEVIWKSAYVLKDFRLNDGTGQPTAGQTEVKILRDNDCLYFGITCQEPVVKGMKDNVSKDGDPNIWLDDCVEIFLDPGLSGKDATVFHVIINGIGCKNVYQSPIKDGLNEVTSAASREGTCWKVEAAIKTARLNEGAKKENWGLLIARARRAGQKEELSSSIGIAGGFSQPEQFDQISFKPVFLQQGKIGNINLVGATAAVLNLKNLTGKPAEINVKIQIDASGKLAEVAAQRVSLEPSADRQISIPFGITQYAAKCSVLISINSSLQPSSSEQLSIPLKLTKPLEVLPDGIYQYLNETTLISYAKIAVMPNDLPKTQLKISIQDAKSTTVGETVLRNISPSIGCKIDTQNLTAGDYTIVWTLLMPDEKSELVPLAAETTFLHKFAGPFGLNE